MTNGYDWGTSLLKGTFFSPLLGKNTSRFSRSLVSTVVVIVGYHGWLSTLRPLAYTNEKLNPGFNGPRPKICQVSIKSSCIRSFFIRRTFSQGTVYIGNCKSWGRRIPQPDIWLNWLPLRDANPWWTTRLDEVGWGPSISVGLVLQIFFAGFCQLKNLQYMEKTCINMVQSKSYHQVSDLHSIYSFQESGSVFFFLCVCVCLHVDLN